MKRIRVMQGHWKIFLVSGFFLFVSGIVHGENPPGPLTFHFLLTHNGENVKCESEGSQGYNASAVGRNHIKNQSLSCIFLIGPEDDQPVPTFCSLMGLDEKLSCGVRRSDEFWAVSFSSETHPVRGRCSVICQAE